MTALRPIKKKIQSERGASITFALLLFLVCAVLCSVLITAGTAAAGRMSRIAETDQRFYAVTSAAELLKDLLDGKSVTLVEKEDEVYLFDKEYEDVDPEEDYIANNQVYGTGANGENLLNSTLNLISFNRLKGVSSNRTLSLTSAIEGFSPVTIEEDYGGQETLTLTLYNSLDNKGEPSTATNRYTLTMTFYLEKADISPATKVTWSLKSMKASGGGE